MAEIKGGKFQIKGGILPPFPPLVKTLHTMLCFNLVHLDDAMMHLVM